MRLLLHILMLFFTATAFCQPAVKDSVAADKSKPEDATYTIVEQMPEPVGGMQAFYKDLSQNIMYPPMARERSIGGKVFVRFVVLEDGKLDDIIVQKSSGCKELDDEAVRYLKIVPNFAPGKHDGRPVKVFLSLPINFAIYDPYYIFNVFNRNEEYQMVSQLIRDGRARDAFDYLSQKENITDTDMFYLKAVLQYYYKSKSQGCKMFAQLMETADKKSMAYANCEKFTANFCK